MINERKDFATLQEGDKRFAQESIRRYGLIFNAMAKANIDDMRKASDRASRIQEAREQYRKDF